MEYRIIRYSCEYKEKLMGYLHQISPEFSDEYVLYNVEHSDTKEESQKPFLVVNQLDNIVGCHLFYPIKAYIKGEEVNTCWGHDTYVDENYRRLCSIDFIMKINRVPAFGIGVTTKNKKIQESIRTSFIPGLFTYCFANYYFLLFHSFSQRRIKSFISPSVFVINKMPIERVESSSEIMILNNGFWYKNENDVDFIRDRQYLDDRFFHNKVFKYYVYTIRGKSMYFVVRPILFRGFPMLSIVDYRCDVSENVNIMTIISAAQHISKQNKLAGVVLVSNDKSLRESRRGRFSLKREITLVANKYLKLSSDISLMVTSADADVDFLRI